MSGFEFFFSLYGLILGLALAELLAGLTNVIRAGRLRLIGLATALMAIEVAFEIVLFWLAAWHNLQDVKPQLRTLALPILSGAGYYIAASLVFPRDPADRAHLDDYFMAHKRQIATCLLIVWLPNIFAELPLVLGQFEKYGWGYLLGYYVPFNGAILLGYLVLIFTKSRRWAIAALILQVAWFSWIAVTGY
ncbi:MAG: hypothetical protein V4659_12585 [Pseudomonadota bacterium]